MIVMLVVFSVLLPLVQGEVDEEPHKSLKGQLKDSFGTKLQMFLLIIGCVLIIMLIICTEAWTRVSWLIQFQRMFAVCFFISIIWNWFHLYKTAFANHQKNLVKLDSIADRCSGLTKMTYWDNIVEWYRTTFTLQDDPCKEYYEALVISPFLLVPPQKAFLVTITTCFTEPMKYIGKGINEFTRALLKDLPLQIQMILLVTVPLFILVLMYRSAQAVIQQAVHWKRRGLSQDPPHKDMNQARINSLNRQRRKQLKNWSTEFMNLGHSRLRTEVIDSEESDDLSEADSVVPAEAAVNETRRVKHRGSKNGGGGPQCHSRILLIKPQNATHSRNPDQRDVTTSDSDKATPTNEQDDNTSALAT